MYITFFLTSRDWEHEQCYYSSLHLLRAILIFLGFLMLQGPPDLTPQRLRRFAGFISWLCFGQPAAAQSTASTEKAGDSAEAAEKAGDSAHFHEYAM
jgi:hypothetical protein